MSRHAELEIEALADAVPVNDEAAGDTAPPAEGVTVELSNATTETDAEKAAKLGGIDAVDGTRVRERVAEKVPDGVCDLDELVTLVRDGVVVFVHAPVTDCAVVELALTPAAPVELAEPESESRAAVVLPVVVPGCVPLGVADADGVLVRDCVGGAERICDSVPVRVRPVLSVCEGDRLAVPDTDGADELVCDELRLLLGPELVVADFEGVPREADPEDVEVPVRDRLEAVADKLC